MTVGLADFASGGTVGSMPRIDRIRNAARAVIIEDGHLLVVTMADERGPYAILPGGGQRPGETLPESLRRECLEELGCEVAVGELLYVREYLGHRHEFSRRHRNFHQLEAVFACRLVSRPRAEGGGERDRLQTGVAWWPLAELSTARFYPAALRPYFRPDGFVPPEGSQYLGDLN